MKQLKFRTEDPTNDFSIVFRLFLRHLAKPGTSPVARYAFAVLVGTEHVMGITYTWKWSS